jgi:hypothetical protein
MKRSRPLRRTRQTPNTEQLIHLSTQLGESTSKIEDTFWESRLDTLIRRLLANGDEDSLLAALDALYDNTTPAYGALIDCLEACVETPQLQGIEPLDSLLIAIPVLAWSRFAIASGAIPTATLATLRTQLQAHVLAANVKLALCDVLLSPDQLPTNYLDTARLAERLAKTALHDRDLKLDPRQLPETITFLSDTRYLLGIVVAPKGEALFRWQEADGNRAEAFQQWAQQGGEAIRSLLPACALEFQPIGAYHASILNADRAARPWSLRAVVTYLHTTLNIAPAEVHATIALFADDQVEEYRIGFSIGSRRDVVHGVVWPLLDGERDNSETPAQIDAVLREAGITQINQLSQHFPLEYCDDCGAPLYPSPDGEPMHAELPEAEAAATPRHLH